MGRRILVPVDGYEQAELACDLATSLFPEAEFYLLHVINPADAGFASEATIPSVPDQWYDRQKEKAQTVFDELKSGFERDSVEVRSSVEVGQPAQTIIDFANREEIDHIVMGSAGRQGVSRLLLGSVAENVIRRSSVPVTIAR